MALITHQTQGSYATFASTPSLLTKSVKLKPIYLVTLPSVGRAGRCSSLKHISCLSVRARWINGPKGKRFKVSAFKGNVHNDESSGSSSGSKFPKNSVKFSYVQNGGKEIITESPEIQNVPLSCNSEERDGLISGSPAIRNLFKKWLMILRTQSLSPSTNGLFGEQPPEREISETSNGSQKREVGNILKAAWCYFLGLDAMIKLPLLILLPCYLAVNVVYGAEVSKELTPLWVFGPLIIALYIKMFQGICALYVFSFKQAVRVVKNLPFYYLVAYNYVSQGKFQEHVKAFLWQPVIRIKNLNYKELLKKKRKEFEEWLVEKYLDYVESIWPYYCRTIRFLKRANLI